MNNKVLEQQKKWFEIREEYKRKISEQLVSFEEYQKRCAEQCDGVCKLFLLPKDCIEPGVPQETEIVCINTPLDLETYPSEFKSEVMNQVLLDLVRKIADKKVKMNQLQA